MVKVILSKLTTLLWSGVHTSLILIGLIKLSKFDMTKTKRVSWKVATEKKQIKYKGLCLAADFTAENI